MIKTLFLIIKFLSRFLNNLMISRQLAVMISQQFSTTTLRFIARFYFGSKRVNNNKNT